MITSEKSFYLQFSKTLVHQFILFKYLRFRRHWVINYKKEKRWVVMKTASFLKKILFVITQFFLIKNK